MSAQLSHLEQLEDRSVPAPLTALHEATGPAPTAPQAPAATPLTSSPATAGADFPTPGPVSTAAQTPAADPDTFAVAAAFAAGPALSSPGDQLTVSGRAFADQTPGFDVPTDGAAVFVSPSAQEVDRLQATALPLTALYAQGFRGRIVFPNTNMQDRSPTLPGPMEQPFPFLVGSGTNIRQPGDPDVDQAGRPARLVAAAEEDVQVEDPEPDTPAKGAVPAEEDPPPAE